MWAVEQKEMPKKKYKITTLPFHAEGRWPDLCYAEEWYHLRV